MKRLYFVLALVLFMCASVCAAQSPAYPDGIYRGFYYEGGIEQISIQFELKDGLF